MKKKNLRSLSLNKRVISSFDQKIFGGFTIDTIKHDLCKSLYTKCDNDEAYIDATIYTDKEKGCAPQGCK